MINASYEGMGFKKKITQPWFIYFRIAGKY